MASKYKKGDLINNIEECLEQDFIFYKDKVVHAGWFKSWQVRLLNSQIKYGNIYKAIRTAPPDPQWAYLETIGLLSCKIKCNQCGHDQLAHGYKYPQYCSNCGRKMKNGYSKPKTLTYKGYVANIKYSREDQIFHGVLDNRSDSHMPDFVNFEAVTYDEAVREFHNAINDYLGFKDEINLNKI